jgi:iron complex outermembrane recepter protein
MFYLSYAEGLSAPRTDNLYSVRRQADGSLGRPTPESETTKAFDLGWRLNSASTIASLALWKIDYTNRIASSYDPDLGYSVDRNVGDVDMWGAEGQIGQRFGDKFTLTGSAAYTKTELLEDFPFGVNLANVEQFVALKGNSLVETPEMTFALRADYQPIESLHFGLQGKWVDDRFATDLNDEVTPAYTIVDFDASYTFKMAGDKALQLQLNVSNLLDEEYFGTISSAIGTNPQCQDSNGTALGQCTNARGQLQSGGVGFYSIGAPRTILASLKFNF